MCVKSKWGRGGCQKHEAVRSFTSPLPVALLKIVVVEVESRAVGRLGVGDSGWGCAEVQLGWLGFWARWQEKLRSLGQEINRHQELASGAAQRRALPSS